VATVDPDEDSIRRWVVWHYRYDPDRRERRNVVVAAFDNAREFQADIEKRAAQLRLRKERGEDVDPTERISGQMYEPGYRRLQRNAHLLRRAVEHGVVPARITELDLPSNVGLVRAERRAWGRHRAVSRSTWGEPPMKQRWGTKKLKTLTALWVVGVRGLALTANCRILVGAAAVR
jgi:hypothetical protein